MTPDVFTIGHSNLSADRFLAMVKSYGITTIADIRSVPFSRRFPWFSSRTLADRLHVHGIAYVALGDKLGGRPADKTLYCNGIADYESMARTPDFRAGLDRVTSEMRRNRLCLMCAERDPLDCHRFLLVGRALSAQGCTIGHILGDGSIASHAATEQRLLAGAPDMDDLFGAQRLDEAYRQRAREVASRLFDRMRPRRVAKAASS